MSAERAGFDDELAFWDEQISGKGQYSSGVLTRLDLTRQPPEYRYDFEPLILQLGRESGRPDPLPMVVDVGSGPASIFSYGAAQGRFHLVAADPLADEYVEILRKYGYESTSKMIPVGGEELTRYLPKDSCDFSWSYNAIDHAEDPGAVFDQMVLVTRPGGIIAIQVFENEATAASWTGLHQHNISSDAHGSMVCTPKTGESRVLAHADVERYELGFPLAIVPRLEGRRWLTFFFRKRPRPNG